MKQTPFTTRSGVQIGLLYEAPRVYEASNDMERLQTALINPGHPLKRLAREWSAYIAYVAIVIVALAVASCAGVIR